MDSGAISWRQNGRDLKLTTRLHLVSRLQMSGAEYLLPPDAFMMSKGQGQAYLS